MFFFFISFSMNLNTFRHNVNDKFIFKRPRSSLMIKDIKVWMLFQIIISYILSFNASIVLKCLEVVTGALLYILYVCVYPAAGFSLLL